MSSANFRGRVARDDFIPKNYQLMGASEAGSMEPEAVRRLLQQHQPLIDELHEMHFGYGNITSMLSHAGQDMPEMLAMIEERLDLMREMTERHALRATDVAAITRKSGIRLGEALDELYQYKNHVLQVKQDELFDEREFQALFRGSGVRIREAVNAYWEAKPAMKALIKDGFTPAQVIGMLHGAKTGLPEALKAMPSAKADIDTLLADGTFDRANIAGMLHDAGKDLANATHDMVVRLPKIKECLDHSRVGASALAVMLHNNAGNMGQAIEKLWASKGTLRSYLNKGTFSPIGLAHIMHGSSGDELTKTLMILAAHQDEIDRLVVSSPMPREALEHALYNVGSNIKDFLQVMEERHSDLQKLGSRHAWRSIAESIRSNTSEQLSQQIDWLMDHISQPLPDAGGRGFVSSAVRRARGGHA